MSTEGESQSAQAPTSLLTDARDRVTAELKKVIRGQDEVIEQLLIAIFSRGHCLLEGVPGLAKTLMVSTLAQTLHLDFRRIQFTPDLMPADITGFEVIEEDRAAGKRRRRFLKGPLFANVILADEINRTPPKTQAALLEAMQERQVSVGRRRRPLAEPFFVLATQNPIEQEGTYPLPEAQQDRFMFKLLMTYPKPEHEKQVAMETTGQQDTQVSAVLNAEDIRVLQQAVRGSVVTGDAEADYALRLVARTRANDKQSLAWAEGEDQKVRQQLSKPKEASGASAELDKYVRDMVTWGAGTRAVQYLLLGAKVKALFAGRSWVWSQDIADLAKPVLRHRIVLSFAAESEGITPDDVIEKIVSQTARIKSRGEAEEQAILSRPTALPLALPLNPSSFGH